MDRFALCHEEFAKLLQGFLDETLSGEEYARFVDLLRRVGLPSAKPFQERGRHGGQP